MDSKALTCPFTSASGQVIKEYFIGRSEAKKVISQTVIQPSGSVCNFSIVGLPRIGKSSLLKNLSPYLKSRYRLLISPYLSLDTCKDSDDMWERIVKLIDKELKRNFRNTKEYIELDELLRYELDEDVIDYSYIEVFSRCLRECGFRVILMLDEFDWFSRIAVSGVPGQLRTLIDSSESGIRVITASRRTIELIENETADSIQENVSNLAGLFTHTTTLRPFNDIELCEYWEFVSKCIGNTVSKEYRNSIEDLVGGHPCLLNHVNFSIWIIREGKTDFLYNGECAHINTDIRIQLQSMFRKHIIEDLKNWNLLKSLYNITWGGTSKLTDADINRLQSYGLIETSNAQRIYAPFYISISEYFTDWLKAYRYDMPFIDMWDEVERKLRKLVFCYCEDKYEGNNDKMRESFIRKWKGEKDKNIIEQKLNGMRDRAKKNSEKFPGISNNFIDHSEPSDIPAIFLHNDWEWFRYVFGGELRDWKIKFNEMAAMRNIHNHNNENGISKTSVIKAKEYCQEAIDLMDIFFEKHNFQTRN